MPCQHPGYHPVDRSSLPPRCFLPSSPVAPHRRGEQRRPTRTPGSAVGGQARGPPMGAADSRVPGATVLTGGVSARGAQRSSPMP
eukprot:1831672-Alexandrium_andersonii.AAC.1